MLLLFIISYTCCLSRVQYMQLHLYIYVGVGEWLQDAEWSQMALVLLFRVQFMVAICCSHWSWQLFVHGARILSASVRTDKDYIYLTGLTEWIVFLSICSPIADKAILRNIKYSVDSVEGYYLHKSGVILRQHHNFQP